LTKLAQNKPNNPILFSPPKLAHYCDKTKLTNVSPYKPYH
jgi:hypothetical protein